MSTAELFDRLTQIAAAVSDGHFTVMKFTTNWRVTFSTPADRWDIDAAFVGRTFQEAAMRAIDATDVPSKLPW
jgi:hypothetical protein